MVQPLENQEALRILLIDDELSFCQAVEDILRNESVELHTLQDPSQAISRARAFQPQLILLDVYFSNTTGLSILDQLKNTDDLNTIPVIMLTSSSQKEHIESSRALGAVDYLVKPFRVPYFYQKLNQYLPRPIALENRSSPVLPSLYLLEPDLSLRQFLLTLLGHQGYRIKSISQLETTRTLKTSLPIVLFNPHRAQGQDHASYCTAHQIEQIHYAFDLTRLPVPEATLTAFLNTVKQIYHRHSPPPCQK